MTLQPRKALKTRKNLTTENTEARFSQRALRTQRKESEMYIIVSKYTKTIEGAKNAFNGMINYLKVKGIIPLLCQNERGFFVARALAKDEEYVSNGTWQYKNTKDPSITETLNIIEEL